ncbi:hypothetical protein [Antarctobacter jejuensis]|uniref:hypothetical protein n=1 Tax=Antarctobacter jejuensis TaxID=1439938 RepID=UPI003FD096E2
MSKMKALLLALSLLSGLAGPLAALSPEPRERTQIFASCLGRYSAIMEHNWLMGEDSADAVSHREVFEMLLFDVAPASGLSGPEILDMRIRAKMAHAHLLQTSTFHRDPTRKQLATANLRRAIRPCEMLILA